MLNQVVVVVVGGGGGGGDCGGGGGGWCAYVVTAPLTGKQMLCVCVHCTSHTAEHAGPRAAIGFGV